MAKQPDERRLELLQGTLDTLALWLFVPITFQKLAISLTHLFNLDAGAQSISTMPPLVSEGNPWD